MKPGDALIEAARKQAEGKKDIAFKGKTIQQVLVTLRYYRAELPTDKLASADDLLKCLTSIKDD